MLTPLGISGGPRRSPWRRKSFNKSVATLLPRGVTTTRFPTSLWPRTQSAENTLLVACVFFSVKAELWLEGTWDLLKTQDTSLECSNLQQARVIGDGECRGNRNAAVIKSLNCINFLCFPVSAPHLQNREECNFIFKYHPCPKP